MSLLERVYFFHSELSRGRYPNTRTLMREFEVSLATARRDISYLRDRLAAPLAYDQQHYGYYYTEHGFSLPFENTPRIVFLLGTLKRLAEESGLSNLPELRQLEERLSGMVAKDYQHIVAAVHCEWIEVEYPDPKIFDIIIDAVVKRRRLSIAYRTLEKKITERIVEPVKLINYQGRWYLLAWCLLRCSVRLFHLARISHAEQGEKISGPAKAYPEDFGQSFGIFKGEPRYRAKILFTGRAAELVKNQVWHKDQSIAQENDGISLHLPVHDDREIMLKVLQYGAMARVLEPEILAERIKTEGRRIMELYDSAR